MTVERSRSGLGSMIGEAEKPRYSAIIDGQEYPDIDDGGGFNITPPCGWRSISVTGPHGVVETHVREFVPDTQLADRMALKAMHTFISRIVGHPGGEVLSETEVTGWPKDIGDRVVVNLNDWCQVRGDVVGMEWDPIIGRFLQVACDNGITYTVLRSSVQVVQ